ncbi:MAG: hypothetical protein Q4D38_05295 [Planctomycetia bacterium]|nr:hypothetical protein [Planctomycetia bacterium]
MADYTPYQQKIIQRYYDQYDTIALQRLGELATDLYLAEGKKLDNCWKKVETIMRKIRIPEARIAFILQSKDPVQVANLVKELGK